MAMTLSHDVLLFLAVLFIATAFSSFTLILADDTTKENAESLSQPVTDDTSSSDDSKEKRSQEEIMFGNQQNKPNGLVDDLMEMTDDDNSTSTVEKKSTDMAADDQSELLKGEESEPNDVSIESDNWYNSLSVNPKAMHYLNNGPLPKALPAEGFSSNLYDQEDLYRRKRQILERPLPLRKRSLRTSLGQMIQKRRLPRRSMRLKRQVDVQDILDTFGNGHYLENDGLVVPHSFSGRAQTVSKRRSRSFSDKQPRRVPPRHGGYPETPEFRYPYVFQHRDDGVLANTMEDAVTEEAENFDDIDNYMLLPPNSRASYPDLDVLPFSTREEENEAVQKWLARHTTPSLFRVSRRASPFFYPIDYRYMPGMKKRSSFSGRFSGDENPDSEFGKWGHVVQVPEAYASPEDIVRLYGLANLLAEGGEDIDARMRRSA